MRQKFHSLLCMCRWVPFKNEEQNFWKKSVITLLFKLKVPVTGNKSDFGGDIQIKFHVVYVIKIWVDIRKMHTSKLTNCLASIVIIQYHLARWCKFEIHTIDRPSDLSVDVYTGYKQGSLQRELKMTSIDFAILNSYVAVTHLRFIKSTNFCVVK